MYAFRNWRSLNWNSFSAHSWSGASGIYHFASCLTIGPSLGDFLCLLLVKLRSCIFRPCITSSLLDRLWRISCRFVQFFLLLVSALCIRVDRDLHRPYSPQWDVEMGSVELNRFPILPRVSWSYHWSRKVRDAPYIQPHVTVEQRLQSSLARYSINFTFSNFSTSSLL